MLTTFTDTQFEIIRVGTASGTFHVERVGRGNSQHSVVLLHGFGTNASLWRGVSARLAHHGYEVFAPDLLGHGASAWPCHAPYTLAWHADALAAAFAELGVAQATVVGQDVGGLVALMLAARHPEVVTELVIINPPDRHTLPPGNVLSMQCVADRLARCPAQARGAASDNRVGGAEHDTQLAATALVAALLANGTADPAQLPSASVARYLRPWLGDGGAAQLCRLAHALANDSLPCHEVAAVVARTLVIRGHRDRSVPETVAHALTASLQDARLRLMPQQGRLLAEDAPDALATALTEFVEAAAPAMATEPAVHA